MSAFIHENESFDRIFSTIEESEGLQDIVLQGYPIIEDFVIQLRLWNYAAVNARYPHLEDSLPAAYTPKKIKALTSLAFYKILESVNYQNSEHKDWVGSVDKKMLDVLLDEARAGRKNLFALAEYRDAPWSYGD